MIRIALAAVIGYVLVVNRLPELIEFIASLDRAGFTFGALVGLVMGLGIIVIGYRIIYNGVVESDRRAEMASLNKKPDARRI